MSLRVVFDTSTLVSAALRPNSVPDKALRCAILSDRLYVAPETLGELERILKLNKFDQYVSVESRLDFMHNLRRDSTLCILPKKLIAAVGGQCRDCKDDLFLVYA